MRRAPTLAALLIALAAVSVWVSLRACAPEFDVARERREADASQRAELPAPATAGEPVRAERKAELAEPAAADANAASDVTPPEAKPLLLHVIDAALGFELEEAEVRGEGGGRSFGATEIPDLATKNLLAHGCSPLTLSPTAPHVEGIETIYVAAPGYAPVATAIDWASGGERTVALARAARLELVVRGRPAEGTPIVELRRIETLRRWIVATTERYRRRSEMLHEPSGWPRRLAQIEEQIAFSFADGAIDDAGQLVALASTPRHRRRKLAESGPTTIDGLEPGSWCVFVLRQDDERPAAAGVAVLAAGATGRLELDWREPVAPPLVHVAGRLLVDPLWLEGSEPPASCDLHLGWRADRLPPVIGVAFTQAQVTASAIDGGADGSYAFDAGELMPGAYVVELSEWRTRLGLEVPAGGTRDAILRVPAPVEVDLALLDAVDGSPVTDAQVNFKSGEVEDAGWNFRQDERTATADGHVRFRAPIGMLELTIVGGERHASTFDRFAIGPGRNERTIRLGRGAFLKILLRDGDSRVAWDVHDRPLLERAGARLWPWEWSMSSQDPAVTFRVGAEGRWRLTIFDVPGFEPSAPVDVDLVAGETTSVEIPLRPAR